jgi:hypothetical protein
MGMNGTQYGVIRIQEHGATGLSALIDSNLDLDK